MGPSKVITSGTLQGPYKWDPPKLLQVGPSKVITSGTLQSHYKWDPPRSSQVGPSNVITSGTLQSHYKRDPLKSLQVGPSKVITSGTLQGHYKWDPQKTLQVGPFKDITSGTLQSHYMADPSKSCCQKKLLCGKCEQGLNPEEILLCGKISTEPEQKDLVQLCFSDGCKIENRKLPYRIHRHWRRRVPPRAVTSDLRFSSSF